MSITLQLKSTDKERKKFSLVMTFASRLGLAATSGPKLTNSIKIHPAVNALKNPAVFGGRWSRAD